METETPPADNVDEVAPLPVPASRWDRILYGLVVIALPIICFSMSGALTPEWQSGDLSAYLSLMFVWQNTWFFFPLLFYAAFCMLLLLIAPKRFAPWFVVRFGVYTGFLLSLHYVVLLTGVQYFSISFISAGLLILGHVVTKKIKHPLLRSVIIFGLFIIIGAIYGGVTINIAIYPPMALITTLIATPFLCLTIGSVTSIKLIKIYETKTFKPGRAVAWMLWLSGYLLALRLSILQAIEMYNTLPKSPPDCYIATASARGHQRFVGSTLVTTPNGKMYVTRQLQNLKCAEIALMALTPQLHKQLRHIYDRFGPLLAARLNNPFLADLAYLMLKPVEWVAMLVITVVVPEINTYTPHFYSQKISPIFKGYTQQKKL